MARWRWERQGAQVNQLLTHLTDSGMPWASGGDFNLLPSEPARAALPARHQQFYNPQAEITPLYARYQAVQLCRSERS